MKKYHQLLLLIVTIVSISLFLVYRHEYNRLHYVLEVFNFFGKPCRVADLEHSENVLSQYDWGPPPVWQEYEDGSYIYSSFWTKGEAKAIGFVSSPQFIAKRCYLWYEDEEKAALGKVRYSRINPEVENAYFYYCEALNSKDNPYAVTFANKPKNELLNKKSFLVEGNRSNIRFDLTICVPPSPKYNKRALIEFISFHKVIGVNSFVFYNRNIPYKLVKLLTNMSTRLEYNVTFLSWNFPKNADETLTKTIVENDCILRTLGGSRNVLTLDLNDYIVPTKYYYLRELLTDFGERSEILSLPVQYFCTIYKPKKIPIALQNVGAFNISNGVVYNMHRHVKDGAVVNTQILDGGFASIHKYVDCNKAQLEAIFENKSILKYFADFDRSTLVQLLKHNQI